MNLTGLKNTCLIARISSTGVEMDTDNTLKIIEKISELERKLARSTTILEIIILKPELMTDKDFLEDLNLSMELLY